jgi:hexosaminidase
VGARANTPAFATRGLCLDVSRSRVPTMEQLRSVVDLVAAHRGNHFELYIEHAFRYPGHEAVSDGCSPITPGELTRLCEYAADKGVTLAANQNCLGHMTRWLRHPRYAHLAETRGRFKFGDLDRDGPFSLCPTDPEALELACGLIEVQLACVKGGLINIGCDEAFDVGAGRSADLVAAKGYARVYGQYVGAVVSHVMRCGGRAAFWADGVVRYPEAMAYIDTDAVALVWGYEPDAPFASMVETCRADGREVWVCPGTSAWRSLIGRTRERRENLARAVCDGLAAGATGLLVCEWGDCGHLQQWPIAQHAIAEAIDAAWTGEVDKVLAPPEPAATDLSAFLDQLGDADVELRAAMSDSGDAPPLANAGALFTALWPARGGYAFPADPALWKRAGERLAELARAIPGGTLVQDELDWTIRLAILAAETGTWMYAGEPKPDRWRERLQTIEADHRRLWRIRSRRGGLDESCRVFTDLRARLEAVARSHLPAEQEHRS